jgi:hypothetical protein
MLLLVQSYAPDKAPYINCLEVGSFSYWFDKPWFDTEGRLATVLIIPSSWCSQLGGQLHAITSFLVHLKVIDKLLVSVGVIALS